MTTAILATDQETTARAKLADVQLAHGLPTPRSVRWQDTAPDEYGAGVPHVRLLCLHVDLATRAEAEKWARALKIKAARGSRFYESEGGGWCAIREVKARIPEWTPGVVLRLQGQETAWWDRPGGAR